MPTLQSGSPPEELGHASHVTDTSPEANSEALIEHLRPNLDNEWLFTRGRLEDFDQFAGVDQLRAGYGACLMGDGGYRYLQRCG